MTEAQTDLCIAGGGPAGMMAGLLFARAGVRTTVLEKHGDFLRDFRGDTVHPSTLEIFHELGLLDELLSRPHDEARRLTALIAGKRVTIADFSQLRTRCRFIALMPQWEFLDCVAAAARRYPGFELRMNAEATGVATREGRVTGVRFVEDGEERVLGCRLLVAADGRRSVLREQAELPLEDLGAPMDVLWFRLSKPRTDDNRTTGVITTGCLLALIDRGDYWQCAYILAKGAADQVRARGLNAFRGDIAAAVPFLSDVVGEITDWSQVKLLSVALDRLTRWHRPGFLAIGDAAHAMSPIGGVGINLAIQDAVAAANLLAGPMAAGRAVDDLLGGVQRRRMWPTRVVQAVQRTIQNRIIGRLVLRRVPVTGPPLPIRLMQRLPALQSIPAYVVGVGVRPEHVRSPEAPAKAEIRSRPAAAPT